MFTFLLFFYEHPNVIVNGDSKEENLFLFRDAMVQNLVPQGIQMKFPELDAIRLREHCEQMQTRTPEKKMIPEPEPELLRPLRINI